MKSAISTRLPAIGITAVALGLALGGPARADINIYDVTAAGSNDFVPFEDDGTPNRPFGSHLGNTITFAGSARYLTHVQAVFASIGPREVDTYTLDLYRNDGAPDPNGSGLLQPGTLIASFTTQALNQPLPGNGGYGVDWNFAPTLVPDSLTAVISSSYSTITPGQFMGPFVAVQPPLTGSAVNTIWYGDGTPGRWAADPNWAIADGGVTNYIDMRFDALTAVPEPASVTLAALGLLAPIVHARLRRPARREGLIVRWPRAASSLVRGPESWTMAPEEGAGAPPPGPPCAS
jgi:hypothetical protein